MVLIITYLQYFEIAAVNANGECFKKGFGRQLILLEKSFWFSFSHPIFNSLWHKTVEFVTIPMHSMVKEIITKYNGEVPSSLSNQKMNEYLKDIGEAAELDEKRIIVKTKGGEREEKTFSKFQLITTHTARRSFATNLYNQGFPSIYIMKITGHRTEKAFLKYIKIEQEEAANKLMEFWKGKQMKKEVSESDTNTQKSDSSFS